MAQREPPPLPASPTPRRASTPPRAPPRAAPPGDAMSSAEKAASIGKRVAGRRQAPSWAPAGQASPSWAPGQANPANSAGHAAAAAAETMPLVSEFHGSAHQLARRPAAPPGGNNAAWNKFQELDADGSGYLDHDELEELLKHFGVKSKLKRRRALEILDADGDEKVTFRTFLTWYNTDKENRWRKMKKLIKDMFLKMDTSKSGLMTKLQFGKLGQKACTMTELEFDVDTDWASVTKDMMLHNDVVNGNIKVEDLQITFLSFERWWKERMGVTTADIPVLPEYMVQVVEDVTRLNKRLSGINPDQEVKDGNWGGLKDRLLWLVRLQNQWGNLHDIYDAQSESRFVLDPLPKWIRDPDSSFSAIWDLTSVVLLLFVSIMVPMRACFEVEVELWTTSFFIDLFVDIFFIVDVCLNFRTAYYNPDGTREERVNLIAKAYLRSWFTIDFFSCLPLGYIPYFFEDEGEIAAGSLAADEGDASSSFRAVKALRLIRLSKMLRLARIRKILTKYGSAVNMQVYVSIGFTLFLIFFLVHMLTCIFYVLGGSDQTLPNGVIIQGWVSAMEAPQADGGTWDDSVSLGTRYVTSTYLCLNALENGNTDAEKSFALASEFVRDFILGLVAGLITTVSMAMNSFGEGSQEGALRLRDLRNWMQKKSLPKSLQLPIMEYCNELWSNRSGINVDEFFADLPPTMRSTMLSFLYGATVARNPLFRGLSVEVINGLCGKCKALYAMPNQKVMNEGESGREMYMVISGELEVLQNHQRLGFLSEGSFFGEAAVLCTDYKNEVRTRTVIAATDSELCYLTYEDLDELKEEYAELKARLSRFSAVGQMRLTGKKKRQLFPDGGGGGADSGAEGEGEGSSSKVELLEQKLKLGGGGNGGNGGNGGGGHGLSSVGDLATFTTLTRGALLNQTRSSNARGAGRAVTRAMLDDMEARARARLEALEKSLEQSQRSMDAKLDLLLTRLGKP